MIFYNFFPNLNENFISKVKCNNNDTVINFQEGAYNMMILVILLI